MAKRTRVPKLPSPKTKPGDTHENAIAFALTDAQKRLAEQKRGHTNDSFRDYFCANLPTPDYKFGRHTNCLIDEMQKTADIVGAGGCRYLIVMIPPRHGKSDVISRRFPAYALTRYPEYETILATYAATLSEDMAHTARRIFEANAGKHGLKLYEDRNQLGAFKVEGHQGGMYSVGLGGAMTGRGAHFFIIDDYCKGRAEAESETIRDGWMESFRSDVITRVAPNHAIIILATPWHPDDLIGRILKEMKANPDFPQFEVIRFPAYDEATGKCGGWRVRMAVALYVRS
jgi:hypothetical protein